MQPRVWLTAFGFLILGFGQQPVRTAGGPALIPAGTAVNIRTTHYINADSSSPNMKVSAVVDDPVNVDGHTVIPRGAPAVLEVVNVERSSNMEGRDRITLKVLSIGVADRSYPVSTNHVELKGKSEGKKATRKILGGAGIGALAGGILGGGTGAAIGAVAGGTTGAVVTGSGKEHLQIPPETRIQFTLNTAVRVR